MVHSLVKWRRKDTLFSRPRPCVSGYFWIHNFFSLDTASVHSYPWIRQPDESATFWIRSPSWKFLNTLWIRNRVDAESGYFFIRWLNKIEPSSLPWTLHSRWQPCSQVPSLTCLYDACSVANIPRGVMGTRVNPDKCRIRVDGQIRFAYWYVWTWKFLSLKRKSCGFKNIRMCVLER